MESPLEPWVFPPETAMIANEDYVDLEVIDISLFDPSSSDAIQQDMISRTIKGLSSTGFIVLKGHGLTRDALQHQFALGKHLLCNVSEDEKQQLHASITQGSWAGYKPQGYFKRPGGGHDSMEHYDLYPFTAIESRLPSVAKPYLPDIRSFIEHNHYHILQKVVSIISLGLGLDRNTLWKLHHRGGGFEVDDALRGKPDEKINWKHTKDHLRYVIYHPQREDDRERHKYLWLPGHTDLGSITLLYSQPIAGLQVLTSQGEWKYVRHYPDQIIVDLGDSMEFITGGVLKAAPHRVKEPPEDQRHFDRLGLFYFVPFLPDVLLSPIDNPSLRALGAKDLFQQYYQEGGKPMTSEEWLVERSKLIGTKWDPNKKNGPEKALQDITFRYNKN